MHTVLRLCEYLCSLQPHSVCNAVMFVHRSAATRFICCLPLFQVIETTLSLLTPSPSSSLLLAAAWLTTPHSLLFSCPLLYLHCLNFHKLPLRKPVFFTYKSSLAPFPKLLLSFFPSYLRNNSPPFFCLGLLIFLLTSWISLRVYVLHVSRHLHRSLSLRALTLTPASVAHVLSGRRCVEPPYPPAVLL